MDHKKRLSTGIPGLDSVLGGGLVARQNVLLRGPPGVGKTIFGLHFLSGGPPEDESLYINLGEPTEYVERTADAFGLNDDSLSFLELAPTADRFTDEGTYTVFESAEVENPSLVSDIRDAVERLDPDRVLIDPVTEFRYLTTDDGQFRAQILGLLDFLKTADATVLMTSQAAHDLSDTDLQFLTDAVVHLDQADDSRTLDVTKFRGPPVMTGPHAFEITTAGIALWPRLQAKREIAEYPSEKLSSGVPELDQLLRGGLERGTVTFFSGPTGAGKTTTGMQFVQEAASRGTNALVLLFEESRRTLLQRCDALNIPLSSMLERGGVDVIEVRPDEYTVQQVVTMTTTAVSDNDVELVLFDGLQGFKQNLRGLGNDPTDHLVRLGRYLHDSGVTTIVTNEVHDITGSFRATEEGVSNLADNVIFLRHVEHQGRMEKVIGVLKMRTSDFEQTLRRVEFTEYGISVGDPITDLQGVLTGTPEWDDATSDDSPT